MTSAKDSLKERLARYRQIKLSVIRERAGRREALSAAHATLGHAVGQERFQEPVDAD